MLVLTRKCGERIVIGPDIELTVISITKSKVRLAIAAPEEIAIYRHELHSQIFDVDGSEVGRGRRLGT